MFHETKAVSLFGILPGLRLLLHRVQGTAAHTNNEAASLLCETQIDLEQLGEHLY